jgi:hypothetical protein
MLLVHDDGMSLRMVVTWPGLLGMSNLVFSDAINTSPNLKPLSWKMIFKLMLKVFLMNTFSSSFTLEFETYKLIKK